MLLRTLQPESSASDLQPVPEPLPYHELVQGISSRNGVTVSHNIFGFLGVFLHFPFLQSYDSLKYSFQMTVSFQMTILEEEKNSDDSFR